MRTKLTGATQRLSRRPAAWLGRSFPAFFDRRVRNPIFVIGMAKSGKSLVCSLLRLHPDLAYWREANEIWDPSGYPWVRSARKTPPLWADPAAYTLRWWRDAQPRRHEIRATFGAFQWFCRRPYFLNDTPLNTFRIPYLLDMFPDARFVHVIRDGREVVCWRITKLTEKIRSDPAPYQKFGLTAAPDEVLIRLARYWRETMEEVDRQSETLRLRQTGRLLELKYEELCANTSLTLVRTFEFAGLDPSCVVPAVHEHTLKILEPRWRGMLDPRLVKQVRAAMEPMLTQKGYA